MFSPTAPWRGVRDFRFGVNGRRRFAATRGGCASAPRITAERRKSRAWFSAWTRAARALARFFGLRRRRRGRLRAICFAAKCLRMPQSQRLSPLLCDCASADAKGGFGREGKTGWGSGVDFCRASGSSAIRAADAGGGRVADYSRVPRRGGRESGVCFKHAFAPAGDGRFVPGFGALGAAFVSSFRAGESELPPRLHHCDGDGV